MKQFGDIYSKYYDLLYQDKNYEAEVEYIIRFIKKYSPNAVNILDIGCGTGRHDEILCKKGFTVHGVDFSKDMLKVAESRKIGKETKLSFSQANITELKISRKFDVVISLFHVMSYLTTNDEIIKVFEVVKKHLKNNGIFIFDFWYGPAVLTDLPVTKVKRLKNASIKVTRIAEPIMHATENIVDVNFDVFIEDKLKGLFEKKELHRMRYFFDTELEIICRNVGLKIEQKNKWMSDEVPDFDSWNTVWIVKK